MVFFQSQSFCSQGYHADLVKSKNHTTYNQSQRNGIKKTSSQKYGPLNGTSPTFLRNMVFAKKHKNSRPEEDTGKGSACARIKAPVKPRC